MIFTLSCVSAVVLAASASALQMYTPDYNDDQIIGVDFQGVAPASPIPGSPWNIANGEGGEWTVGINRDGVRGVTSYGFSPGIEPFTIAADGSISSPQPTLVGSGGYSLAMSPTRDLVYFAANGITVAAQAADGSLSYITGSPFMSGSYFNDIAITPDGKYLFTVGAPANTVRRFSIAADGSPVAIGTATVSGGELMQVSPDGRSLYVIGTDAVLGNDLVHSLTIGADGSLTEVLPAYDMGDTSTGKLAVSPDGSRLYVPNANLDQIVTLARSATGALSLVGATPALDDVKAIAASASGELFIVQTNTQSGLYYSKPDPFTTLASTPVQLVSENWNYGTRTAFRPGVGGTVGSLKVTPRSKPLSFTLEAAGSAGFARLDWSTGSPATITSTTTTKTNYQASAPGVIPISVKAVDSSGCSSDLLYTGQLFVCSGNPNAVKSVNYDTPAWVTSLRVSPKTISSKSKVKFKLTEKASVSFYVQKSTDGRMVGSSCKKRTTKNRAAKKCSRWLRASKTFRVRGKPGKSNSFKFSGKIGKKKLRKGKYRFFAVATDSSSNRGPAKTASFRIRR